MSTLQVFYAIEGFRGDGSLLDSSLQCYDEGAGGLVYVGEGLLRRVWASRLSMTLTDYNEIFWGDWRVYCEGKDHFIDKLIRQHTNDDVQSVAEHLIRFLPFLMASNHNQTKQENLPLCHLLSRGIISERRIAHVSEKWPVTVE
jgi:hypothetical protein